MSLTGLARSEIHRVDAASVRRNAAKAFANRALGFAHAHSLKPDDNLRSLLEKAVVSEPPQAVSAAPEVASSPGSNALDFLVKYIPTESATLYLAAVSGAGAIQSVLPFFTPVVSYWFFAILTPLLLLMILAGKRRTEGLRPLPADPKLWPWWSMFASLVAFIAWGLAVPANPYNTSPSRGAAFAFLAVFVSTALSLLEPLVGPKAQSS